MEKIILIKQVLEIAVFAYFFIAALYLLVFAVAGKFKTNNKKCTIQKQNKFAVLIPGYKEDNIIVDVAKKALKQSYPQNLYDVIIIADSFNQNTIKQLKELPVLLIEVSFDLSTKSKALNKAMEQLNNNYDVALILDADNVMEYNFLSKINEAFNKGYQVVQAHRVAKNTNTNFAILDAISEEINNHIFRKAHRVLGLSAALIGSGMAFNYTLFKGMMKNVNAVGGFDKELELKLLSNELEIEYLEDALVYDEKVSKAKTFGKQRRRWLSAQFVYFRKFFVKGVRQLILNKNFDFFDKVYQMILLPRVLLLGITLLVSVLEFVFAIILSIPINSFTYFSYPYWFFVFILILLSLLISIPRQYYSKKTLKAVLSLPNAFLIMFLALFKLKNANKKFIHTTHGLD